MLGRSVRFISGFVVGFLSLPIAGGLIMAVLAGVLIVVQSGRPSGPAEVPSSFWTEGYKVTQAGGASVRVERTDAEVTQQMCREACDDLIYWFDPADRVEVRNAGGDCLLCEGQGLRLPFTDAKRWGLTGHPLRLEEDRR